MQWDNAVITNAGVELLSRAAAGEMLTINSAGLGGGTVDIASLMVQTELKNPLKVAVQIAEKKALENGISVLLQINNTGLSISQRMKQVGLFAKIGSGNDVLFAILQDDTGEEIPAEAEYPDFLLEFRTALAVSNTDNIDVTIDSSVFVTKQQLDLSLNKKSDINHTHDDRYYTESEINTLLKGKSDTSHKHTVSQISDFPKSLPANGGNSDSVGGKTLSNLLKLGLDYSDRLQITEGDLDNYHAAGRYVVPSESHAKLIAHSPWVSSGYFLDVYYRSIDYSIQIAMAWIGKIKIRYITGGEWSDWEDISDGGNAATVNGLTVQTAVPANAKFTDTVYSHPTYTARTGTPTANQTPAFGGTFNITQPISDNTGHITAMNSRTVKIPATVATTSANGLMSSSDKSKLDGIATGANAYTHPSYTARTGFPTANATPAFGETFTVTQPVSDATGHITAMNSRTITIPSTVATETSAGLMSYSDKSKLNSIETGATKITVDSSLSTSSTNTVQNKVITTALNAKANLADIPTQLPANGGNSDTVGNKSISQLMSYGMAYGDRIKITSGDLNDYHTAGRFIVADSDTAPGITNSPFASAGYFLDVFYRTAALTIQIAYTWSGVIKIRFSTSETDWSTWKNINTETAGSLASTESNICLRNLSSGTAAAIWDKTNSTGNCPPGSWYGQHS